MLTVVHYNRAWPKHYEEVTSQLTRIAKQWPCEFEHVGSTSVPGLAAKPIIDILVGVAEKDIGNPAMAVALKLLGFHPLGLRVKQNISQPSVSRSEAPLQKSIRIQHQPPDRRIYARREEGSGPHANLHVVALRGDIWQRMILFRDLLRTHKNVANEYGALKQHLAAQHAHNRHAYRKGKGPFVDAKEQAAVEASNLNTLASTTSTSSFMGYDDNYWDYYWGGYGDGSVSNPFVLEGVIVQAKPDWTTEYLPADGYSQVRFYDEGYFGTYHWYIEGVP
jgi:GrpB-like predicted nucleotidyltransferase (UPF0157 family)